MLKKLTLWLLSLLTVALNTGRPWDTALLATPPAAATVCTEGYRALAAWEMDFLAVGTGGRVTQLATDGTREELPSPVSVTLHDVAVADGKALIVGDAGVILQYDGTFRRCSGDIAVNYQALARFGGAWVLGGSGGTVVTGNGDGRWNALNVPLSGDVTGLAASDARLVGVTSTGEAFTLLPDGTVTKTIVTAQNGDAVCFHAVSYDGATFWATGERADGMPVVMTSIYGGIFSERALNYMDGAGFDPSGMSVFGSIAANNQMVVACSDGQLLTLPDCVQCNKRQSVTDATLRDVAYNGGKLMAVGDGFSAAMTDDDAVRQYKVTAETARRYQQEDAVIVDVRSAADYAARHIAGAVSIPLDELETLLPQLVPDRETVVVFYCARGVRSQTAVERASDMEYYHAFTLGGIDSWTYAFEP